MAQPTPYNRLTDFSQIQAGSPTAPLPGTALDAELDAVELSLDEVIVNLGRIQRDDGLLRNQSVHAAALSNDALALIGAAGWTLRGAWVPATDYAPGDVVSYNAATYVARVQHRSAAAFTVDLAADRWQMIANAAVGQLETYIETFDGGTDTLTLAYAYDDAAQVFVAISGVLQRPGMDYTLDGVTLTLSASAPAGADVVMVWAPGAQFAAILQAARDARDAAEAAEAAAEAAAVDAALDASRAEAAAVRAEAAASGVDPYVVTSVAVLRALTSRPATIEIRGHTTAGDGGAGVFVWRALSYDADDDGVTIRPADVATDAPGRWVRDIRGYIVSAGWWGAPNDGVTDAYPALQRAFDFLGNNGGTLRIPPGVYRVSEHPTIQDKQPNGGMTVICLGVIQASRLTTFGGVILLRNTADLTWFGGTIDGGSTIGAWGNNGIGTSGTEGNGAIRTTRLRVAYGTFRNCRQGAYFAGGKGISNQAGNQQVFIIGCQAYNCDFGFAAESTIAASNNYFNTTSGVVYTGCTARDCTYAGWLLLTTGEWTQSPTRSGVTFDGCTIIDCGGMGAPMVVPSAAVNTTDDTFTLANHGFYSRSSVVSFSAATGVPLSSTLWTVRVDNDTFALASSPGVVHNVLSSQVSPINDHFIAAGPSWQTGDVIGYYPQAGWSATQHPEDATPIGGLTATGRYKVVKVGVNYTSLAPVATTLKTFTGANVNTGAGTITITSHGFTSGDAVRISLGSPNSAITEVPQLRFESPGTALSGVTGTTVASQDTLAVSSAAGIQVGDPIYVTGVRWSRGGVFNRFDFAYVTAIDGTTLTLDGTADASVTGAAVANGAETSVLVGSTSASGNIWYLPETVYFVRAVDANTVQLHRTQAAAIAGTDAITILDTGSGTMALVPPGDLVDITSQGTGLHTFARVLDITSAADTTLYREGFAPVMLDRATGVIGDLAIAQTKLECLGPAIRGRGRRVRLKLDVWQTLGSYVYDARPMGNIAEGPTPGTDEVVDVELTGSVVYRRPLTVMTGGTATSGAALITGLPKLAVSRVEVGEPVTVSAGWTGTQTVAAKGSTSLTLGTDASASGPVTVTLASVANSCPWSSASPGVVRANATPDLTMRACRLDLAIAGYPTATALIADPAPGISYRFERVEATGAAGDNEIAEGSTTWTTSGLAGWTSPRFTGTRAQTVARDSVNYANLFINNSSTYTQVRGASLTEFAVATGTGVQVAAVANGLWGSQSSAWNSAHSRTGGYREWYDASGRLRVKNGAPVSETDGTVVGTQT